MRACLGDHRGAHTKRTVRPGLLGSLAFGSVPMSPEFTLTPEEREQALAVISVLEGLCEGKTGKKFRGHLHSMRQAIEHRCTGDARWLARNFCDEATR